MQSEQNDQSNNQVIRLNSDIIVKNEFKNQPIYIWVYLKTIETQPNNE